MNSKRKMGNSKSPSCIKVGLKKGPWSPEEDRKLLDYIEKHGLGSWRALPAKAGLWRCGKSCRLRWRNYLRPDIKRGEFTLQEEQTIIQLHALLGNRWSAIAAQLSKRTDNEIKNHWNTHLKKRLTKMGIDPVTHKRKTCNIGSSVININNNKSKETLANINHQAQWETARLEAESRLASMSSSKLLYLSSTSTNNDNHCYYYNPFAKTTTSRAHQQPPCPDGGGYGVIIPQTSYGVLRIAEEKHIQNGNTNNNNNNDDDDGGSNGIEVEEIVRVHGRFIPSQVTGSNNLQLSAAEAGAGFMETFPSNSSLQQWIQGSSDHLNFPNGTMY